MNNRKPSKNLCSGQLVRFAIDLDNETEEKRPRMTQLPLNSTFSSNYLEED
jgi:hypothetical protein